MTRGRRFRIDTTVVETNVHYPTDSTLLQDGVRVLTRTMERVRTALGDQPGRVRNRLRSVTRAVLRIGYQARSPKTRDAMVQTYRRLMATTRVVLRDAGTMVRRLGQRQLGSAEAGLMETSRLSPAAVVLDLHLPAGTGLEYLRQLRAMPDRGEVPVAIVTAWATKPHRTRGGRQVSGF